MADLFSEIVTPIERISALVRHVAESQPLLSCQVVFRESDENFERLKLVSQRAHASENLTARLCFRVGLDVIQTAIREGKL